MSLPEDKSIGWWKLEDVNAEIGPVFVVNGTPAWNPCKFNNGFYSNDNNNFLYTSGQGLFNPNHCIFEWWMRTDNDVTNGAPADNGFHTYGFWGYDNAGTPAILIANYPAPYYFYILLKDVPPPISFQWQVGTWLAGVNVHIMLVIDTSGINGGPNTVRLYIDGILANSTNAAIPAFTLSDSFKIGGLPWAALENMEAVIDNLKIYSETPYISQALIDAIIANKDNEGWPVAGGFRMLDGGLKSPMLEGAMM